jgi:protein-S-isoprenylcysteine O-methyltransferase Ste14
MARFTTLVYGVLTYTLMLGAFLYLFGFLANFLVPKGVDGEETTSLGMSIFINLALVAVFAVPHSVMARPGFKKWWTRFVPETIERTTYVLVSTLLTILLFWQWRPMPQVIWHADAAWAQGVLWGLYVLGIVVLLSSTFVINHFDLFGLRQVVLAWQKKPYKYLGFKVTFFYKFVRHPLYVGWLMIFWCTPTMTAGHLLFALGMSSYILIAIRYEERDLLTYHGEDYASYKARVPMLIPRPGKIHETVKAAANQQNADAAGSVAASV